MIEENNLTEENVKEITHSINIYFSDNTSESIRIEYDSKFVDTIMDIELGVSSRFRCFEDLNGEKHFISEENIGLIDIPLYLYKKQLQQFFDNE